MLELAGKPNSFPPLLSPRYSLDDEWLSTVRAADRILVLRQGVILEEGDHDGLLQRGGHYAELYNTYFRHLALGYVPEGMEIVEGRLSVKGE